MRNLGSMWYTLLYTQPLLRDSNRRITAICFWITNNIIRASVSLFTFIHQHARGWHLFVAVVNDLSLGIRCLRNVWMVWMEIWNLHWSCNHLCISIWCQKSHIHSNTLYDSHHKSYRRSSDFLPVDKEIVDSWLIMHNIVGVRNKIKIAQ